MNPGIREKAGLEPNAPTWGDKMLVFLTSLFRTPRLNLSELDEEAKADKEEGLPSSTWKRFGATWQDVTGPEEGLRGC